MYFAMFILLLGLVIAPVLGGSMVPVASLKSSLGSNTLISNLFQVNNRTSAYYNDTGPQNTDILLSEKSALARLTETGAAQTASATGAVARLVKLL
jgi:hypothetical protein